MDDENPTPPKKINAMEFRRAFGQLLEQTYYKGDQFIIVRAGKPMAAVVPLSVLEQWQKKSGPAKTGRDTGKGNKRPSSKKSS